MSDDKKKDDKAPAEGAAAPKKKGGKILFIALPIVGALGGFGVTFALPKPAEEKQVKHEKPELFADFAIPEIKANLARSGGLHFCGVDIHIKIKSREMEHVAARLGLPVDSGAGGEHGGGGKPKDVPVLGMQYGSAVRDRVILLLNSKSIDDLEGREKKELLKKEIRAELDELLFPEHDGEVEAVLFKDILIQ